MRTIVLGWRDTVKEPYCCSHEDCFQDFPYMTPWPPVEHPAKYEIACPCGDSYFLCDKHGEWEATPALKFRKRPVPQPLFDSDDGLEMVKEESLFEKIRNM